LTIKNLIINHLKIYKNIEHNFSDAWICSERYAAKPWLVYTNSIGRFLGWVVIYTEVNLRK